MRRVDIPTEPSMIDAAWLSTVLDLNVEAVRPLPVIGGIPVTSRVLRFALEGEAALPASLIIKIANPAWTHGPALAEREVRFYRDFASEHALPIPVCYHADFDDATGAFVLILEDLSDLQPGLRLEGLSLDEAASVATALANLHRSWWQRPELATLERRGHDAARVARTVATFDERWTSLQACGKYEITPSLERARVAAQRHYAAGMTSLSARPQTLVHCDLHVENFFVCRVESGHRLVIIDWQNASFGNVAFDLSALVTSVQAPLISEGHEHLVARYHDALGLADLELAALRQDVAASVRHQFVGTANWFATFEAESLRDAATLQGHWQRLAAAVVAIEANDSRAG